MDGGSAGDFWPKRDGVRAAVSSPDGNSNATFPIIVADRVVVCFVLARA